MPKNTKVKIGDIYHKIHLDNNGFIIESINIEEDKYTVYNEIIYAIFHELKCEVISADGEQLKIIYKGKNYNKLLKKFIEADDGYICDINFFNCSRIFARRRAVKNYVFDIPIEYEIYSIKELESLL